MGCNLVACGSSTKENKEALTTSVATTMEPTVYDTLSEDEKLFIDLLGEKIARGSTFGKLEEFEIWGIADYENGYRIWYHMVDEYQREDEYLAYYDENDGAYSYSFSFASEENYEGSQYDVDKITAALYELRENME